MIFLLLAILASSCMAIVLKVQRSTKGNRFGIILGNYLTCVLLSLVMMRREQAPFPGSPSTLGMGTLAGVLFVGGLVAMQSSIQRYGAALSSAFSKLGLLVTLLVSFVWFRERPSAFQLFGVLLVLFALVLINLEPAGEKEEGNKKKSFPYGLLLTLLMVGLADVMAKVFAELGEQKENATYFVLLFSTAALFAYLLSLLEKKKTGKKILALELLSGVFVGIPNYFSSYLLLRSLQTLPAFVASPLFSTGTILLVLVICAVFLGERLGRFQLFGIGLILAALVFLGIG